jgi:hypothetical protein
MEQYLIFLLIILTGISLARAAISDINTRKVSIKLWYPAVYIALPISMILLAIDIWNGVINVSYEYYSYPIIYSLIMIVIFGVIAHSEEYIKMGGADYIALTTVIMVLSSINLYLSPLFFIMFFGVSMVMLILIRIRFGYFPKDYKIPLILTIFMAFLITVCSFLIQTNFGALPFV